MFSTLIESQHHHALHPGETMVSLLLHAGLITAAVLATAATTKKIEDSRPEAVILEALQPKKEEPEAPKRAPRKPRATKKREADGDEDEVAASSEKPAAKKVCFLRVASTARLKGCCLLSSSRIRWPCDACHHQRAAQSRRGSTGRG